jgi:hypothetical protein
MPDAPRVAVARRLDSALRIEGEAIADVAGARGEKHVGPEHQVHLPFEERGRAGLIPGRLRRPQRAGTAADLHLVATEEQELGADPRGDLRRGLQRHVLERGLVRIAV